MINLNLKGVIKGIIAIILLFTLIQAEEMPKGWPWKAIDTGATTIYKDPKILDFIVQQGIKYVRIHIFIKNTMRQKKVSAQEALELNLKWTKEIHDRLAKDGVQTFLTIADYPVDLVTCVKKAVPEYWEEPKCRNQILSFSKQTIDYFKGTDLLGYQFLGEPVVRRDNKWLTPVEWTEIFKELIKYRDEKDSSKYLIYSHGPWNFPVRYNDLKPFDANNIIYSAHMYLPHSYTHQRIRKKTEYNYPGKVNGRVWDKTDLVQTLQPFKNFENKYGKPMMIAEFGNAIWSLDSEVYLKDLLDIFTSNNWAWSYYNISGEYYKGWDARFTATINEDDNTKKYKYIGETSDRFKLLKTYY
jgi:hypothetical protein